MKLTNPTDEQLNASILETLAGWEKHGPNKGEKKRVLYRLFEPQESPRKRMLGRVLIAWSDGLFGGDFPKFTQSFDLILPWLDKRGGHIEIRKSLGGGWTVKVYHEMIDGLVVAHPEWTESLPRAIVIALLRAKGVEVEFTK